jgi:hypothetical protein
MIHMAAGFVSAEAKVEPSYNPNGLYFAGR